MGFVGSYWRPWSLPRKWPALDSAGSCPGSHPDVSHYQPEKGRCNTWTHAGVSGDGMIKALSSQTGRKTTVSQLGPE